MEDDAELARRFVRTERPASGHVDPVVLRGRHHQAEREVGLSGIQSHRVLISNDVRVAEFGRACLDLADRNRNTAGRRLVRMP